MKTAAVVVSMIFGLLQYKLWFANGSVFDVLDLKRSLETETSKNLQLHQRNQLLEHEVRDLKYGNVALEEHAREDLGMVKEGETFYQFVEKSGFES
jgi:cell division protein FtsB